MLEGRDKISGELQRIIDERTEPWGVNVISVEVKDVLIPPALENAMSMQAQAERERQARVILGDSERQVAEKFGEAAKTYANDPIALHSPLSTGKGLSSETGLAASVGTKN
jgi:regulator of protease activity HflC (stomatin/prohibitin superfamily)